MGKRISFIVPILLFLLLLTTTGRALADVSAQLQQAETLIKNDQYEQAEAIYEQIVTDYPGTDYAFQAQEKLTCLHVSWRKDAEAQASVEMLISDFSEHKDIAAAVWRIAMKFGKARKEDRAIELHQYNVEHFPEDVYSMRSQVEIIFSHIRDGNDAAADAAVNNLLSMFSQQPTLPKEIYQVAREYEKFQKYDKAFQLYQYDFENFPHDVHAMMSQTGIVKCYIRDGNYTAADAAFDDLLTIFYNEPTLPGQIHFVARKYEEFKKYDKALELYQYNVESFPNDVYTMWSQVRIVRTHILNGNNAAADGAFDKLLTLFSDQPTLLREVYKIAEEFSGAGNDQKTRQIRQYLIDTWSDSGDLYSLTHVAMSHIALGNEAAATKTIDNLITKFKDHPRLLDMLHLIGNKYQEFEKWEDAEATYRKVIELEPYSELAADLQGAIGWTYVERGLYEQAAREYGKVVENYPDSKWASNGQYWVGQCYYKKGDFEQAMREYQKVIETYPDSKEAGYAKKKIDLIRRIQEAASSPPPAGGQSIVDEDSSGCGPSALITLGSLLGMNLDGEEIATLAGTDEQGLTSMYGLAQAARAKGLKATGMKLGFEDLSKLGKPVIAFVRDGHFEVIKEINGTGVVFTDRETGETVMPESDFRQSWDGYILVVEKAA